MDTLFWLLVLLPWILAFLVSIVRGKNFSLAISVINFFLLAIISIWVYFKVPLPYFIKAPDWLNGFIILYDYLLLLYFIYQGIKYKSKLIIILTSIQIFLLTWVLSIMPHSATPNIYIDKLSAFMYLIVNLVGSLIIIFANQYMADEDESKTASFIAILLWFLGVMNFAVSVNNLEWFFALFETTTLASYLLIRFKMDKVSIKNSILALWMNQIAGIAILIGLLFLIHYYGVFHFTDILKIGPTLLSMVPLAFFVMSALIKGAQIPFHKWLLGAMVAPTPVSEILHSATMVKIAPYLILRLSPVVAETLLSKLLIITTGFVFVVAALFSLKENYFKKVLAYSTIALLALMMLAGAIGTPIAITAALILMLFHAISKALLFLEAGVIEKLYKAKSIYDIKCLINKAPITVLFILLGLLSMTMVPFAMFIAKWFALSEIAALLNRAARIITIVMLAIGGVSLTSLYLKVLGVIVTHNEEDVKVKVEHIPKAYLYPSLSFALATILGTLFISPLIQKFFNPIVEHITGLPLKFDTLVVENLSSPFWVILKFNTLDLVIGNLYLPFWVIVAALAFVIVIPLLAFRIHIKADRVPEYLCGETLPVKVSTYNPICLEKVTPYIESIALALIIITLIFGGGMI